jgi:hypothetical protein
MTAQPTDNDGIRDARRPTRPGTFQPGDAARAAAMRSHEARRTTAGAPAPRTAPQTAAAPQRIAASIGLDPARYRDAARVAGLEAAATALPPTALVRFERTAPAWAAGYLDRISVGEVGTSLEDYCKTRWGGGTYRVTVLDADAPAWDAETVRVAGPPCYEGAIVSPPTVVQMPAPAATSPAPAPHHTADPRIADVLERLADVADRLEDRGPPSAQPAGNPDASGLADGLRHWSETNSRIEQALRACRPTAPPARPPQDEDEDGDGDEDEDEGGGPASSVRKVADEWFQRAIRKLAGMPEKPDAATPSVGTTGAAPAQGPTQVRRAERITD